MRLSSFLDDDMKHNNTFAITTGLFVLTMTSCTTIVDPGYGVRTDYAVFGQYAGECIGEQCIEIYKIDNKTLFEDTLDQYPSNLYNGSFIKLDDKQCNEVSHMSTAVPYDIFNLPQGAIGQPDAHDQGGIYLELVRDGIRYFWLIDTMKSRIPEFLHAFVDSAQAAVDKLQ